MKKIMLTLVVLLMISPAAFADTVHITTTVDFQAPRAEKHSTAMFAFRPSEPISFKVAGKTCTWISSSSPYGSGGGAGCNYNITLDAAGNFTKATSNGNGCTESGSAMIKACK